MSAKLQNRYRLGTLLGKGAMGEVYRAHDELLDRAVAVKRIGDSRLDPEQRERWLREARAAAQLRHPHIVAIYDAGEDSGTPYLVMELVEGRPLNVSGPLSLEEVVAVTRQLCDALEHVHARGIVHRDLKPENILIAREDGSPVAKLTDLGVALLKRASRLTEEGAIVGTAAYLAPEQALGQSVDGRADLYALGIVLYEMVAGRVPFVAEDALGVISQHLHAPVVPPRTWREDLPPGLEFIILRCLAKRPEERFGSARELAEALAAVDLAGQAEAPAPAASDRVALLDQLARGRLIGRRAELGQLRELWTRALQGRGHMVLLSGEPGVGKTRLAREMIVSAQLHGAVVLQGGCYEFEATTPYLPFVEALRRWVNEQDIEEVRTGLDTTAPVLARLAPGIEARLGPMAPVAALPAQEERLRLFDAFARFLQNLAGSRGLLLFLDDLHWADHGTLGMLHYLLRNLRDQRLLVLGAYREVELDRAHPLAAALVEWNRERLATRVALGRLELDETSRMLAALFGQDEVSPDFAAALHRETEGNPFFAEEVVKALIEQGQIYREGGEWQRHEVHELTIPQSVKAAIGRRLDRLTPGTIEVLHTAAALGKVFEFAELAAVAAGSEDQLLDALDEASGAHLVRSERDDAFAFTHDKIREVLHEEMNPIRQRRMHQRIGESLEKLYGTSLGEHVQDLAYHFAESSDLQKGLIYSLAAAERAEHVYAHEEALAFLERGRECAEALETPDQLGLVHDRIGRVQSFRAQFPEAIASFERALALATTSRQRAALRAEIGELYARIGDRRGLDYLNAALTELDPESQRKEMATAIATVGRYHHYHAQHAQSIEYLERARLLAEALDDPHVLAPIYSYLAGAYQHLGLYAPSLAWAQRCIDYGELKQDPVSQALGYEFIAEDKSIMGAWREATAAADRDWELGRRAGSQDRMAWSRFAHAWALHAGGDLSGAAASARQALALAERIGEGRLAIWVLHILSIIETDLGERGAGREHAEEAARRAAVMGQLVLRSAANRALAHALLRAGEHVPAVGLCEEALRLGEGTDNRSYLMILDQTYAEALIEIGRLEEARRVIERQSAIAREAPSTFLEGTMQLLDGRRLMALDRDAEAGQAFEAAIGLLEPLENRLQLGRALYHRGLALAKIRDAAGSRENLKRARALFDACGAAAEREQADQALR